MKDGYMKKEYAIGGVVGAAAMALLITSMGYGYPSSQEAFEEFAIEAQEHHATHEGTTAVPNEALTYICDVETIEQTMIRHKRLMCEQENMDMLMATPENTTVDMDQE